MELFVPGRICLFGEHSDWAGGYRRVNPEIERGFTLISGTSQGIYAQVTPHPNALVLTATTPEGESCGPREIPMEPALLLDEAQRGGFWSYVAGVAYQALIHHRIGGLVIHNYKTDLPIRKGLSSSAAICVLTARALNQIYDLKLTVRGEMELAYQGEITTPSRCGRMDQGCAFGSRPVLMTFDGDRLDTTEVSIGGDLHFVIVDLRARKDTLTILSRLNASYPCANDQIARGVQQLLGPINRRVVGQAVKAMRAGDAQEIGRLMTEAQDHFDRYAVPAAPDELAAPVLHRVLGYAPLRPYIWGGKGVGSQGDGSAQFVARSEADQRAAIDIIQGELGMPCLALTLQPSGEGVAWAQAAPTLIPASSGTQAKARVARQAPVIRKAVVPAAGLGTRLFPASKAVKKELFPVIDAHGVAKPALLLIVEEALEAGIEELIIIVQEESLEAFRAFFHEPLPDEDRRRLPPDLQTYVQRIAEMGNRVSFIIQQEQKGFGHAVYQAQAAAGSEPFLLMLGDHIYRSDNARSCARQLLDAFHQHGRSVVGLRPIPQAEVVHYGLATGRWLARPSLLDVARLAEKPEPDEARNHLRVPGLGEDEYLAFFGQYAMTPAVFDYLQQQIERGERERGEFQLTPALERLQQEEGLLGLVVEGHSYDIGLPQAYVRTLQQFGRSPGSAGRGGHSET